MNKQYSFVANSSVMFLICGLAILVVLVQAAIFSGQPGKKPSVLDLPDQI
ncbi:MAG: hypothetical protein ACLRMZ_19000 [Blautia marasmi]